MSHVFISYNQVDADFAAVVMMHLEKAGFDTWIDKQRLRPGVDWSDEIDEGILNAFAVVLVVSPDSRASEYVTYEWSFAIGAGVRVVPVLLRDTEIHPRLNRLQYLDFRNSVRPWAELLDELRAIRAVAPHRWYSPRDTPPHLQRAILDLDSGNSSTRRGAVDVLAESDHPIARTALRQALSHPLRDVRAMAAVDLARLHDPGLQEEVGICALKDALSYNHLVHAARRAFASLGPVAFPVIAAACTAEDDPARRLCVSLLAQFGDERATPLLLELLESPEQRTVLDAVEQLRQLRAASASEPILRLLLADRWDAEDDVTRAGVRAVVTRALIDIGDRSIAPVLNANLHHPVPGVMMSVVECLVRLCGSEAREMVAPLLTDDARVPAYELYDGRRSIGLTVGWVVSRFL